MTNFKYTARNKFYWSFTGYTSQDMALAAAADVENWFRKSFDASEWAVSSSAIATADGFKAEVTATREKSSDIPEPVAANG